MPEKDGYEVCDFIKKNPGLSHIPVLLLTGAFEPFDQDRANRVGCDGYLAKPFEPETLIAKVRDLLSRAPKVPAAAAPGPRPAPAPPPPAAPPPPPPASAIPFVAPVREPEPFAPRSAGFVTAPPPGRPAEPIPFPRAANPVPAPPAAPAFPAPVPPPAEAAPAVSFIPDEPFEDLDAGSLSGEDVPASVPPSPATFPVAREELLPMTAEESQTLSTPPEDASSTVMFRADALPWNVAPPPVAPSLPEGTVAAPLETMVETETEVVTELPVFEEVIEEEVEFTPVTPLPPPEATAPAPPPSFAPPPVYSPPPMAPAPPGPPPPPPVVMAPPPVVAPPQPYIPPAAVAASPPPVVERGAPARPPHAPEPEPAAPEPVASFAEIAVEEPVAAPGAPSEAAGVTVPMDMVEKIAQRVVAQISERVVREIAWEVIPDLAEAMIRAEIERLKGELQRL